MPSVDVASDRSGVIPSRHPDRSRGSSAPAQRAYHHGDAWLLLFAGALFLTFGFGGGTPSTGWLIGKFLLLGVLLTSLLAELASQRQDRRRRDH